MAIQKRKPLTRTQKNAIVRALRAWKRRPARLRKLSPIEISTSIEVAYSRLLRRETQRIAALITQGVMEGLNLGERLDERAPPFIQGQITSTIGRLRRQLRPAVGRQQVHSIFEQVSNANAVKMNESLAPAVGRIPIWTGQSSADQDILDLAMTENVGLIETIAPTMLDRVEATLRNSLQEGLHSEDIKGLLQEEFQISERRADLIARDQVLKINAQLVQNRSQEMGMDGYTWATSKDARVRPDHQLLEGTHQTWDDPPIVDQKSGRRNHPGEDFQCRCSAIVDTEGFLDKLLAEDDEDE